MIRFFIGTDRAKARAALEAAVVRHAEGGARIIRITDANSPEDLLAALQSGVGETNLFAERGARALVLEYVLEREELREALLQALPTLAAARTAVFALEEKVSADIRKRIDAFAEEVNKFDGKTARESPAIFALATALRRGDKKTLWVRYQEQLAADAAPEAIHGVLFWGAKDMLLKSRDERSAGRAKRLVAALAELPHEARRRGEDLEYALERFVLSGM